MGLLLVGCGDDFVPPEGKLTRFVASSVSPASGETVRVAWTGQHLGSLMLTQGGNILHATNFKRELDCAELEVTGNGGGTLVLVGYGPLKKHNIALEATLGAPEPCSR